MSWIIVTEEQRKAQEEAMMAQFKRWAEESERKRLAREAHDRNKCPHCGRNDPYPPWLY